MRYLGLSLLLAISIPLPTAAQTLRHVESGYVPGCSAAVLVEDAPLVHTAQLLPIDDAGKIVAPGDAGDQLAWLLARLESVLKAAGSDLNHVARLNLYVVKGHESDGFWRALSEQFTGEAKPAVSLVTTRLPHGDVVVALDAVAVAGGTNPMEAIERGEHSATMPPGSRIYVSGQAEPGPLREATRKTLESLSATLKHSDRTDADIVQIKCFLTPMTSAAEVQDEINRYYGNGNTPPAVFVEWQSSSPVEIEVVAWGGSPNADAADPLEFITPPGMKSSPLFSRVARIHRGGTIYFSDCRGSVDAAPHEHLQAAFDRLKLLLEKTGSDLQHLAKATYYVTDDEVSQAHNEIRPKYFDPERPPAASKAMVAGTGQPVVRYTMDMIAVPSSRGTPKSGPEFGRGLSVDDTAAGWISLFDGTPLGWSDVRIVDDELCETSETSTRFGICQLRGEASAAGTITVGGQAFKVSPDKPLAIVRTEAPGTIRLGDGVRLRSLAVRPLHLKPLWNGRDLSGWKPIGRQGVLDSAEPHFRVNGGVLRVVGGPAAIEWSGGPFGNLALQIDVRTRAVHSNGGVFFRAIPGQFMNGYEAQLHNRCLDDDPARTFKYATGGLDDRQDARRLASRDFQTFRMTIIADGAHIATWVNGHQMTDWTDDRQPHENPRVGQRTDPGVIQLQAHDPATDYEIKAVLAGELEK